jgi:hypothetical protein
MGKEIFYIKLGGSIVGAILLTFIIMFLFSFKSVPVAYFYNEGTLITDGEVFIDGESIGFVSDTGSIKFNQKICNSDHEIKVVSKDGEFFYAFYPVDCKYKKIEYKSVEKYHKIEKNNKPDKITFYFFDKDNKYIQGRVFFNGEKWGDTIGTEQLERSKCGQIKNITIVLSPDTNISWKIDSSNICYEKDEIKLKAQ